MTGDGTSTEARKTRPIHERHGPDCVSWVLMHRNVPAALLGVRNTALRVSTEPRLRASAAQHGPTRAATRTCAGCVSP